MAKHKDWTARAAEEIADSVGGAEPTRIAAIIAKHHERITKPEPGHIQDWAAKCGAYLHAEGVRLSSHRIAAVVAHFAEPLVKLLREARREHADGDDGRRLCNIIKYGDSEPCTCGADAWNARIDEALNG